MIGSEVGADGQRLVGDWTSVVLAVELPPLDAISVVGDAGGDNHGIFHDLERNGTNEVVWDFTIIHFYKLQDKKLNK